MILDAQHDRSAPQPATVLDETHTEPHAARPESGPIAPQAARLPAAAPGAPAEAPPTNTFEAFGSFSG